MVRGESQQFAVHVVSAYGNFSRTEQCIERRLRLEIRPQFCVESMVVARTFHRFIDLFFVLLRTFLLAHNTLGINF